MPFSVGPLISRASSISANLYAVTNETYQLTKYGECSVICKTTHPFTWLYMAFAVDS